MLLGYIFTRSIEWQKQVMITQHRKNLERANKSTILTTINCIGTYIHTCMHIYTYDL